MIIRDMVVLSETMSLNEILQKFNAYDDITIKVYDNDTQIISGDVSSGMNLLIYSNGDEVCRLRIVSEFVNFASTLKFDDSNRKFFDSFLLSIL